MDDNYILRGGKYTSKTIGWVKENNPGYLNWVIKNAPNLLPKEKKEEQKETVKKIDYSKGAIRENHNFLNEGPSDICKAYLEKLKKENDI